ncbi:MAG: DUF4193 domain-containing protein [Mycobacterium sp.]
MATVTDYDAPRRRDVEDTPPDPLREVASGLGQGTGRDAAEDDVSEFGELFELPGADLSGEELVVKVVPKQADEFTCTSCFLVHHRSRLAVAQTMTCADCA